MYVKKQEGAEDAKAGSDIEMGEDNDSDTGSEAVTSEDESAHKSNEETIQDVKPTMDDVPAKFPADEILLKQRRLSSAASERSAGSQSESTDAKKPKEKEVEEAEGEETPKKKTKKEKKSKKAKKAKQKAEPEVEQEVAPEVETEVKQEAEAEPEVDVPKKSKKEKKAEKKRKRASDAADVAEEPKASKKSKAKEDSSSAPAEAEQWQVGDLDGGPQRQSKFLRLLGAKKNGVTAAAASTVSKGKSDSTKAEAEIQRQFEAGMKMRNEGGSKRRGLGA